MRVLIVTQYYPPETGGPQNRLFSLSSAIRDAGHDVVVVTAKPNYPTGIVFDGHRRGLYTRSKENGIEVVRSWLVRDRRKQPLTRIASYLSFVASAVVGGIVFGQRVDVVLASSPPLFTGVAGWMLSVIKRAAFVFDVRDLWPDVAVALGQVEEGRAARWGRRLEAFIYRKANGVTAVTESFCEKIRERSTATTPVLRISNGTEPEAFDVSETQAELRARLGLPHGFLVLFAGNIGLAQGLDHVIAAAAALEAAAEEVAFAFLGEGSDKSRLERLARDRGLRSIRFYERVELGEAARFMAAADALLVSLGRNSIYQQFIPSKLFDAMAAGKPVLLSVDGEARAVLQDAQAGIYYPAEDAEALVEAVRRLRRDPDETRRIGERGRSYARTHCSRQKQGAQMAEFLTRIAGSIRTDDAPRNVPQEAQCE